jgi:hypothetical protein
MARISGYHLRSAERAVSRSAGDDVVFASAFFCRARAAPYQGAGTVRYICDLAVLVAPPLVPGDPGCLPGTAGGAPVGLPLGVYQVA